MRESDVRYNIADKNYSTVVYPKELSKEQCLLHLEDSKGTNCRITDQTKEHILDEILSKLRMIHILSRS